MGHDDDDDLGRNPFEDALREIAEEIGRSVERFSQTDLDGLARAAGVDPDMARSWGESAGQWLRAQLIGAAMPARPQRRPAVRDDVLRAADASVLDLPTSDQGAALAALESGRWRIEPGTSALTAVGNGPGPRDALGLVRELRARDWIGADGGLTLAGRHALKRWLEVS